MQFFEAIKNFDRTFQIWEMALNKYSFQQICAKSEKNSWSLGQVYMHLAGETLDYNIPQIEICLSVSQNSGGEKTTEGKRIFELNSFPGTKIKSPSGTPKEPGSIDEVKTKMLQIKKIMSTLEQKIETSKFSGKTKHPGLGYLNAAEWYQFIELHFRHHLHQKKRLDDFWKTTSLSN